MSEDWRPRVLVADDEEVQRNIMREILVSAGHEACAVNAGGQCVVQRIGDQRTGQRR